MRNISFRKAIVYAFMILFIGTVFLPNINSEKDIRLQGGKYPAEVPQC